MERSRRHFFGQMARAVCLFCVLLLPAAIRAQPRGGGRLPPRYITSSAPDPAQGEEILEASRSLGLDGDFFLEFDLRVLPRRDEAWTVPGRMWGTRQLAGPMMRLALGPTIGGAPQERYLIQNGPQPDAWRWTAEEDGEARHLGVDEQRAVLGGTWLSLFELQMPFLYWEDHIFEGITALRGRRVYAFLMYPPDDFAAAHPEIGGVRLHLDPQYYALMQAVILDTDEQPLRKLTVLDLKKLGDQWVIKSIDVRDELTRDKVRFEVTGAALRQDFAGALFSPGGLVNDVASPGDVTRW